VIYLLYIIHVVVCLFLIMVVLLQQGKGADLSVFGGGATQAAFGARGAASLLHKLTVWGFVAFIVTTITIGFMVSSNSSSSVMSDVPAQSAPAPEAPAPIEPNAEQTAAPAEESETPAPAEDTAEGQADDGADGQ
jgi:preprotein translocase subunit SecG